MDKTKDVYKAVCGNTITNLNIIPLHYMCVYIKMIDGTFDLVKLSIMVIAT